MSIRTSRIIRYTIVALTILLLAYLAYAQLWFPAIAAAFGLGYVIGFTMGINKANEIWNLTFDELKKVILK